MSGLLERIARRRRAISEHRPQRPPETEGATLPIGPDGSVGSTPSTNGVSTNGVDPIGHFVEGLPLPADVQDAHDDTSEAPTTEFGAVAAELGEVGQDIRVVEERDVPDLGERAKLRRRARYLRRLREIQLRDIGGLLVELHRFGRERPDLLQAKVETAAETTTELREIAHALQEGHSLRELREAGIGGACPACGAVHGSRDRYCASCGASLSGEGDTSAGTPISDGSHTEAARVVSLEQGAEPPPPEVSDQLPVSEEPYASDELLHIAYVEPGAQAPEAMPEQPPEDAPEQAREDASDLASEHEPQRGAAEPPS